MKTNFKNRDYAVKICLSNKDSFGHISIFRPAYITTPLGMYISFLGLLLHNTIELES